MDNKRRGFSGTVAFVEDDDVSVTQVTGRSK